MENKANTATCRREAAYGWKDRLRSALIFDLGTGPSLVVAGSQRSGTTWVAGLINFDHRFRDMYEPFNGDRVRAAAAFHYGLYLRPDNDDPAHLAVAKRIVRGGLNHPRVDRGSAGFFFTRRVIKETRANLFLAWLQRHFPDLPILLVLRHPFAVAASRMALGWQTRVDAFLSQPDLVADHLQPFLDVIRSTTSTFEEHVANWCIDNYVPLRTLDPKNVHLAFYETLNADPGTALPALFAAAKRTVSPGAQGALAVPSSTIRADSAIKTGEDAVVSWKRRVDPSAARGAMRIVRAFGLDRIYDEDPMPRTADPWLTRA